MRNFGGRKKRKTEEQTLSSLGMASRHNSSPLLNSVTTQEIKSSNEVIFRWFFQAVPP